MNRGEILNILLNNDTTGNVFLKVQVQINNKIFLLGDDEIEIPVSELISDDKMIIQSLYNLLSLRHGNLFLAMIYRKDMTFYLNLYLRNIHDEENRAQLKAIMLQNNYLLNNYVFPARKLNESTYYHKPLLPNSTTKTTLVYNIYNSSRFQMHVFPSCTIWIRQMLQNYRGIYSIHIPISSPSSLLGIGQGQIGHATAGQESIGQNVLGGQNVSSHVVSSNQQLLPTTISIPRESLLGQIHVFHTSRQKYEYFAAIESPTPTLVICPTRYMSMWKHYYKQQVFVIPTVKEMKAFMKSRKKRTVHVVVRIEVLAKIENLIPFRDLFKVIIVDEVNELVGETLSTFLLRNDSCIRRYFVGQYIISPPFNSSPTFYNLLQLSLSSEAVDIIMNNNVTENYFEDPKSIAEIFGSDFVIHHEEEGEAIKPVLSIVETTSNLYETLYFKITNFSSMCTLQRKRTMNLYTRRRRRGGSRNINIIDSDEEDDDEDAEEEEGGEAPTTSYGRELSLYDSMVTLLKCGVEEEEIEDECPICMEEIKELCTFGGCGHKFCAPCVIQMVLTKMDKSVIPLSKVYNRRWSGKMNHLYFMMQSINCAYCRTKTYNTSHQFNISENNLLILKYGSVIMNAYREVVNRIEEFSGNTSITILVMSPFERLLTKFHDLLQYKNCSSYLLLGASFTISCTGNPYNIIKMFDSVVSSSENKVRIVLCHKEIGASWGGVCLPSIHKSYIVYLGGNSILYNQNKFLADLRAMSPQEIFLFPQRASTIL